MTGLSQAEPPCPGTACPSVWLLAVDLGHLGFVLTPSLAQGRATLCPLCCVSAPTAAPPRGLATGPARPPPTSSSHRQPQPLAPPLPGASLRTQHQATFSPASRPLTGLPRSATCAPSAQGPPDCGPGAGRSSQLVHLPGQPGTGAGLQKVTVPPCCRSSTQTGRAAGGPGLSPAAQAAGGQEAA